MDLSNLIPNPEGYDSEDILTSGIPPLVKSEVKTILNDAFKELLFKDPEKPVESDSEEIPEKSEVPAEESGNSDQDGDEKTDEEESEGSVLDNVSEDKEEKNQNDLRFASSILASVINDLSKEDLLDAFTLIKKASSEIDQLGAPELKPLQMNLNRIASDLKELING